MRDIEIRPQGWDAFFHYALPVMVGGIAIFVGWAKDPDMALFSSVAVAGCLIWMWLLSRRKAVLTPGRLDYFNGFATRSVEKRELAGYRVEEGRHSSRVVFEYKSPGAKRIAFPLWIRKHPDVERWLADITDLDAVDAAEAQAALERDAAFGHDPQSRLARADFLSKLVSALSVVAIGFMLGYSFDIARSWLMLGMIALPLVALALEFYFPGQLRLVSATGKADPRPLLLQALVFPIFLLSITAAFSLHILNLQGPLLWAAPIAAVIAFYIAAREPDLRASPVIIGVAVGAYAYAYGALAHADVLLDRGLRQEYPVTVVDLHENHGRHASYHVGVGPWVHNPDTTDFSVNHDFYANLAIGETLCIALGHGTFGWSWYDLETCPDSVARPHI